MMRSIRNLIGRKIHSFRSKAKASLEDLAERRGRSHLLDSDFLSSCYLSPDSVKIYYNDILIVNNYKEGEVPIVRKSLRLDEKTFEKAFLELDKNLRPDPFWWSDFQLSSSLSSMEFHLLRILGWLHQFDPRPHMFFFNLSLLRNYPRYLVLKKGLKFSRRIDITEVMLNQIDLNLLREIFSGANEIEPSASISKIEMSMESIASISRECKLKLESREAFTKAEESSLKKVFEDEGMNLVGLLAILSLLKENSKGLESLRNQLSRLIDIYDGSREKMKEFFAKNFSFIKEKEDIELDLNDLKIKEVSDLALPIMFATLEQLDYILRYDLPVRSKPYLEGSLESFDRDLGKFLEDYKTFELSFSKDLKNLEELGKVLDLESEKLAFLTQLSNFFQDPQLWRKKLEDLRLDVERSLLSNLDELKQK